MHDKKFIHLSLMLLSSLGFRHSISFPPSQSPNALSLTRLALPALIDKKSAVIVSINP
jgi:hypothetical protein